MLSTLAPFLPEPRPGDAPQRVRAARPDLPADAPAFRAAVVLLAGPELRFNIDRIATRCALPRPWVAACVRRLIDNGVWACGRAEYSWRGPDDFRFWNDAAVGEGRLLRRALPEGGVEWAPAGAWEKAYDFLGPQSDPGGAVLYMDTAPEPAEPGPVAARAPAPEPAAERPRPVIVAAERETRPPAVRMPTLRRVGDGWLGMAPVDDLVLAGAGAGAAPDLFPGANWLY